MTPAAVRPYADWHLLMTRGAAPESAGFHVEPAGSVMLDVPTLGAITVDRTGARAASPTDESASALRATVQLWAWGQWLAYQGVFSFHGVTLVDPRGLGVAIIGMPRAGTSLTGLALARRGWRLIADDVCPLIRDGDAVLALPGRPTIQVDAAVVEAFPPDEPIQYLGTPRPRAQLVVPSAPATEITRVVCLVPSNVRRSGVLLPADPDGQSPSHVLAECCALGAYRLAVEPKLADEQAAQCESIIDAVDFSAALVPAGNSQHVFAPSQIADLISEYVSEQ